MKIMIATSYSAFSGMDEYRYTMALKDELIRQGHTVDLFILPVAKDLLALPEQIIAARMINIGYEAEMLITVGYPALAVPYRNKIVVLFSLVGELYERWDTEYGVLGSHQYISLRDTLHQAESRCLKEGAKVFCGSGLLQKDIKLRYGIDSVSLNIPSIYHFSKSKLSKPEGAYVICETNLNPDERIDLLLDAVIKQTGDWRLVLSVPAANDVYINALNTFLDVNHLNDRVIVEQDFMNYETVLNAIAYVCIPVASRRVPFAAVAAMENSVPIITTQDSGSLAEYITHGETGLVVQPDALKLAEAIKSIISDKALWNYLSNGCAGFSKGIPSIGSITQKVVTDI